MDDEAPPRPLIIAPEPPGLVTTRASEIEPEEVRWLWPQRIALGKLLMIAGDPGLGKSLFTLDLAARVSKGLAWPVGSGKSPLGSVLIVSAEDDAADTIVPRLMAAGADLSRIHILAAVRAVGTSGEVKERELSLEHDVKLFAEKLAAIGDCLLVVIDPISAYLGHIDTHRNSEVRAVLAPLSKLAQATKAAFCLVSHLNKGSGSSAAYRVSGSIAFTAAVRASLLVIKDRDDPQRRLVIPGKNNLGADNLGGIAYHVQQNVLGKPHLAFESEPVMISADEALEPLDDEQSYAREEAAEFLSEFLRNGPVPANDVVKAATTAGISKRTLDRAKALMGVHSGKREFSGGTWYWSLRPLKPAKVATSTDSSNGGNLREFGNLRTPQGSKIANSDEGCQVDESMGVKGTPTGPEVSNHVTTTDTTSAGNLLEDCNLHTSLTSKIAKNIEDCHVLDGRGVGNVGEDGIWRITL